MDLSADDVKKYKAFTRVIAQGKFDVSGEAIETVASLFSWFRMLGTRMEQDQAIKPLIASSPPVAMKKPERVKK